jgi:flagellar motor switch protein FliN/FliY
MTQQIEKEASSGEAAESAPPDANRSPVGGDSVPAPPPDDDQTPEPSDRAESEEDADSNAFSDLARLGEIQVKAAVELGTAELLVRELAALVPGSVIKLNRLVGESADLTVNGRLFAHGDIVVVEDNLGLRVTKLVEPAGKSSPRR